MTSVVRKALDAVEEVLLKGDQDAADLAALLSALRGPDNDMLEPLKAVTTCRIRAKMFPRLANIAGFWRYAVIWSFCWGEPERQPIISSPTHTHHFKSHVNMAIEALERKD